VLRGRGSLCEEFRRIVESASECTQTCGLDQRGPLLVVLRKRSKQSFNETAKVILIVRGARHARFIGGGGRVRK
jgi:hypothetical protein